MWARVDTTPFGYGSPFSRSQLTKLLKDAMFSPEEWEYALYMPPFDWRVLLKWPVFWERLGLVLWPAFSGVILVEATKQIYAAVPVSETRNVRRRVVPVPAGVTRAPKVYRDRRNTACSPNRFCANSGMDDAELVAIGVERHGPLDLGADIAAHRSKKSLMVQRWMLGVSYQRSGRLSVCGILPPNRSCGAHAPMAEIGK